VVTAIRGVMRPVARDPRVDAYLDALPGGQRDVLQRLREQITRVVPEAEETISYGMPTFRLGGKFFVSYAGWKRHCSLYPLTDSFRARYPAELEGLGGTKGSVHFTPERPLPDEVVEELIRARVADLEGERGY
jgi:uncharacterized protein YdhG (YjbR/CyaY superfamily)